MIDEHEAPHLSLPELNSDSIKQNHNQIMLNRDIIMILIFTVVVLMSIVGVLMYKQHGIHNCQEALYTHLTKQTAPKIDHSLFEDSCMHKEK